jgi:hypothetical protein
MASAQESNKSNGNRGIVLLKRKKTRWGNQVLRQPKERSSGNQGIAPASSIITARQLKDHAGKKKKYGAEIKGSRLPKEKLRRGNRRIAPAKWKIETLQSKDRTGQKQKTAARQLEDSAGQKKNCGAAIKDPASLFRNCGAAIWSLRRPKEKIAARQSGIAPASSDSAARQSGYRADLVERNCGAAIGVLHWPLQKKCGAAIGVLRRPN